MTKVREIIEKASDVPAQVVHSRFVPNWAKNIAFNLYSQEAVEYGQAARRSSDAVIGTKSWLEKQSDKNWRRAFTVLGSK